MKSINQLKIVLKSAFNFDNNEIDFNSIQVSIIENTNSNKKISWSKTSNTLSINLIKLDKKQILAIRPIIQSYINDDEGILLQRESKSLLERIYEYNLKGENVENLACTKGIIPQMDYQALEASYFIKSQMNLGKNSLVSRLKNDIFERYGRRGGDIANLCTAGYFDEHIIPLISNTKKEEFQEEYEKIVGLGTQALFVHGGMSETKIIQENDRRITYAEMYGLQSFHIHCRGSSNIKIIDKVLKEYGRENEALRIKSRSIPELTMKVIDVLLK